MVKISLPDNSVKEYPSAVSAAQVAMDISPRLAKAAVAAEVDGRRWTWPRRCPRGPHLADPDRPRPGRPGGPAPHHRPRDGPGHAPAVRQGRAVHHRPGADGRLPVRLLLRLRPAQAHRPGGPAEDRGRRWRRSSQEDLPIRRLELDMAEARRRMAQRGPAVQGRDDRRPGGRGARRSRQPVRAGRFPGHVPRPAPARHRPAQGVQAAEHRRGVLARRREEQDAHPHLRHGVLRQEGPRRAPGADRGGQEARPPRDGQAAGPVPPGRRGRAGPAAVDAQGRHRPHANWRTGCAANWSSAATSRSSRRTSAGWSCTAPAGTSRTTRTASSRPSDGRRQAGRAEEDTCSSR